MIHAVLMIAVLMIRSVTIAVSPIAAEQNPKIRRVVAKKSNK
jgi:hypothetical protein